MASKEEGWVSRLLNSPHNENRVVWATHLNPRAEPFTQFLRTTSQHDHPFSIEVS